MRSFHIAVLAVLALGAVVLAIASPADDTDYSTPAAPQPLDPRFDVITTSGADLTLHYLGATRTCNRFVDLVAEETETTVRLTLIEERYSTQQFCNAEGIPLTATVSLDEPLGSRQVTDATSNQTITTAMSDDSQLDLAS